MMIEAHTPEALLSFEETPGASETINTKKPEISNEKPQAFCLSMYL